MWTALQQAYNRFDLCEDDFLQDIDFGLGLACVAIDSKDNTPEEEMILSSAQQMVEDVLSFLLGAGFTAMQIFAFGSELSFGRTLNEEVREIHIKIVCKLNHLRSLILHDRSRGLFEASDRSQIQTNLSLFRIQTAIEKSAYILLSLEAQEASKQRHKLSELFMRYKDLVVIGEPGSGKSWSLARFCDQLHQEWREATTPAWIPVYVSAAEVMSTLLDSVQNSEDPIGTKELARYLLNATLSQHPVFKRLESMPDLIQWLVHSGCLLTIYDGINEVPIEMRARFAEAVNALQECHPHNRVFLASRKLHWNARLFPKFYTVAEILPLDDSEVTVFVNRFFENLERPGDGLALNRLLCGSGMERAMSELRRNPFFLDKLTRIYAETKSLPANRGDLFRDYIAATASLTFVQPEAKLLKMAKT